MMCKQRKRPKSELYIRERENGMSVTDIAKRYGVSYQAVLHATAKTGTKYFKNYTAERCVYPNLRQWLNDNKITINEFARRMGLAQGGGSSSRIIGYFNGRNYPQKETIDKMIEVTGLSYEEMFYREDA